MPLPIAAAVALGSLLGGSQTTQTTTVSSSNVNAFTPNINFGGGTSFNPALPTTNDFVSTTVSSQTQEQADPADLLAAFSPATAAEGAIGNILGGGSAVQPAAFTTATIAPSPASGLPVEFIIGGIGLAAVATFALFRKKPA